MPPSRLDDELQQVLQGVDSPTLANAIEVLDLRDRSAGFLSGHARCFFPDLGVTVGRALTATVTDRTGLSGRKDGFWKLWYRLEELGGPTVIVMKDESGRPERVAYCGEIMATMAKSLGAVALVTDGGVRDLEEVHALGLQYFSPFPVVSHANFEISTVGEPVTIFGEVVDTGDILHGDRNGVVVCPDVAADELRRAIEHVRSTEAGMLDFARSDAFTVDGTRQIDGY